MPNLSSHQNVTENSFWLRLHYLEYYLTMNYSEEIENWRVTDRTWWKKKKVYLEWCLKPFIILSTHVWFGKKYSVIVSYPSQAVDMKVLASLTRDDLKKMCGDSYPDWISFPIFEQVGSPYWIFFFSQKKSDTKTSNVHNWTFDHSTYASCIWNKTYLVPSYAKGLDNWQK